MLIVNTKTLLCIVFFLTDLNEGIALADDSFLMKVLRSKLVQNKNDVEVQRNDPSSPLHSVKSFEELPL